MGEHDFRFGKPLLDRIESNLAAFEPRPIDNHALRRAAVAIVIAGSEDKPGMAAMLLTRRPARLNQHAGQYALPGGKLDPGESVHDAALRELHEELGIALGSERILGVLDDYPTRSKFCITPVVVWADVDCPLRPSPDEVAQVYRIPLGELDSDAIPLFEEGVEADRPVLCCNLPTLGHRMYSPTASMVYQFREVAIRGLETRVAHFDQPGFAWK